MKREIFTWWTSWASAPRFRGYNQPPVMVDEAPYIPELWFTQLAVRSERARG